MSTSTLGSLISSRIRRALLEHLLAHPAERFYLRGLAKTLNLSVSPTRRELLHLEEAGLLKAYDEANVRFYVVDRTSPLFLQLTAALRSSPAPVETPYAPPITPQVEVARPAAPSFSWKPAMEGVALSLIVAGVLAGVAYVAYTNQRLLLVTKRTMLMPKTQVTVVESPQAQPASGAMRGSRWQLVPGGMGGVSAESY